MAGTDQKKTVVGVERSRLTNVVDGESILVFRDLTRCVDLDTAEMKEHQRLSVRRRAHSLLVDVVLVARVREHLHLAPVEIPVGDVVAGVLDDTNPVEQSRNQIHPLLVNEQAVLDPHHTAVVEAALPPAQEAPGLGASLESDEAQVVGAGLENRELARERSILDRSGEVWSEEHIGALEQPEK